MCVAAIAPVLSMAVGVAGAMAQHSASMADYNAKSAAWRQNVINAQAAARDEQKSITLRNLQEQGKLTQKKHVSFIEEAQKRGEAEVAAVEGGATGLSLDNLLGDITNKSLQNRTIEDTNYQYIAADLTAQQKATVTRMEGRIASVARPVAPSPFVPIIQALGAGVKFMGSQA